jgi:DNA-binding LytR/AlgR family response regulator
MGVNRKVFIAEDNVIISEQLKEILEELDYDVVGIGFDDQSSREILEKTSPDLAIIDIRMHGVNAGFEIANYIKNQIKIPFIFLTSHSDGETVEEAAKHNPAAYLLKPFRKEQIYSTLQVVFQNSLNKARKITLNLGREKRIVSVDEILWLKTDDKYIEIQTRDKKYVVRNSISSFIKEHNLVSLTRVHRSYAVNIDEIELVQGSKLYIDGTEIPISRKHAAMVKTVFN